MSDLSTPLPEESGSRAVDEALAEQLVEREEGVELVGPGGNVYVAGLTYRRNAIRASVI